MISTKRWQEIRDGYGLIEVPAELRQDLGCCMCSGEYANRGKLYTPNSVKYGTIKESKRVLNQIRNDCYCRTHAIFMYDDER